MRLGLGSWKIVAAGIIAAGVITGCGSSSSTSSASRSSPPATTAAATTGGSAKQVVRVFGLGTETDASLGALFPAATIDVTEASLAAQAVNRSSSSKVTLQYTFCDNKGMPAGSVSCARQAISPTGCGGQPCDVALETGDSNDYLSVPLIGRAGMATVSGSTGAQAAAVPDNFCISGGTPALYSGLGYVMKRLGVHKAGIVSLLRPDIQTYDKLLATSLGVQGVQVAGQTIVPPTTVSPNAAINSVMTGGANGLVYGVTGPVGPALVYAEHTYPGVKIGLSVLEIAKPFFAGVPNSVLNGIGVAAWNQPSTATSVPGIAEWRAEGGLGVATAAYRGDDFSIQDWLAVRFIANVADTINGKITKASLLRAFQTAQNVNMYGIMPPWNASDRGKDGALPCSPYHVIVAETLQNQDQVADNPGVFINASTGQVGYVDPGSKAP